MKKLTFKLSKEATIGVELEIQLLNPVTYDLTARAKDLIRTLSTSKFHERFKPEISQSMIEITSSIQSNPSDMLDEFLELQNFLFVIANDLGVCFCGGGNHPFEDWTVRKIFPTNRFKRLSHQYQYLSKHALVYGQHIHVGCKNGDDAIYLTHAFARYVPQLIALSASSPYFQGTDTGFQSSRVTVFNAFPTSGVMPNFHNWESFTEYFYKMQDLGIISSMKDIYWDIRPKPEYGTVEIRVCDMPLTIEKAVAIAAYIQALSIYILRNRPIKVTQDLYFLYPFNRFQACRYGFQGDYINHETGNHMLIQDDIMDTFERLEPYINALRIEPYLENLFKDVKAKKNDSNLLREIMKQVQSFPELVKEQCLIWNGKSKYE